MNAESKADYKRLRNRWGVGLAVAWVVLWYLRFESQHDALMAAMKDCESLNGTSWASCKASHGVEGGGSAIGFFFKMVLVVVSAPFAFLVSSSIARKMIDRQESEKALRTAAASASLQLRAEQQRAQRTAELETAARNARETINRTEFILKLGSVSDLLELRLKEQDQNRIDLMQQGIANELRDLVAKHTLSDLTAMINSDEAIQLVLGGVLVQLQRLNLTSTDSVVVLGEAMQRSKGVSNERPAAI